jgi:DNA-binding MarR family transcriptional regulator
VLRVHLTAEDLLRTRFARQPAPLIELGNALVTLARPNPVFGPWSHAAAARFPPAARMLLDLVPASGTLPVFLDPIGTELAEGLELVQRAPARLVADELHRVFPDGWPAPWIGLLATQDRRRWRELGDAMRLAYRHLCQDAWPRVRSGFRAELAWRSGLIAELGVQAALSTLDPAISWDGTVMQIAAYKELDVYPGGAGLTLLPSVIWTGRPTIGKHPDGSTVIVYAALTPLPLIEQAAGDPLAGLLGRTRAAVLRVTLAERTITTTTGLSRELGISLGTVSGHTKTLRAAGLIVTTRDGKAVRHLATPLGRRLLESCSPPV